MLIGITGKAGAGKDTVAEYLWRKHGFVRIAFADPLKRAVQEIFGLSDEQTWGREHKEVPVHYWGMSPRRMMQLLGTDCIRKQFGGDVWVKRWVLSYKLVSETDCVVVPDVRFVEEADAIRRNGGKVIRISRGAENGLGHEAKRHESEMGLPDEYVSHTISNDGSFDDLYEKIEAWLACSVAK